MEAEIKKRDNNQYWGGNRGQPQRQVKKFKTDGWNGYGSNQQNDPSGNQRPKRQRGARGKSAGKALAGLGKALALTFDDASELVVSQV